MKSILSKSNRSFPTRLEKIFRSKRENNSTVLQDCDWLAERGDIWMQAAHAQSVNGKIRAVIANIRRTIENTCSILVWVRGLLCGSYVIIVPMNSRSRGCEKRRMQKYSKKIPSTSHYRSITTQSQIIKRLTVVYIIALVQQWQL